MPRSGIAGSYILSAFSFWGTYRLYSIVAVPIYIVPHQQCMGAAFSPHSLQHLLFANFLVMAFLTGAKWYLIVILIWSSLIISSFEHLFMCFLAICMSSWEKYLFRSPQFWLGCFVGIELYELSVHFGNEALVDCMVSSIFSFSVGCLFLFCVIFLSCTQACKFD